MFVECDFQLVSTDDDEGVVELGFVFFGVGSGAVFAVGDGSRCRG